jgi:hypothetical protein
VDRRATAVVHRVRAVLVHPRAGPDDAPTAESDEAVAQPSALDALAESQSEARSQVERFDALFDPSQGPRDEAMAALLRTIVADADQRRRHDADLHDHEMCVRRRKEREACARSRIYMRMLRFSAAVVQVSVIAGLLTGTLDLTSIVAWVRAVVMALP